MSLYYVLKLPRSASTTFDRELCQRFTFCTFTCGERCLLYGWLGVYILRESFRSRTFRHFI
jgi:hypothetical protein